MIPAGLSTASDATENVAGTGRVPATTTASSLLLAPDAPGDHTKAATTKVASHDATSRATTRRRWTRRAERSPLVTVALDRSIGGLGSRRLSLMRLCRCVCVDEPGPRAG